MEVTDARDAWLEIPATAPDQIQEFRVYSHQTRPMVPRVIHAMWRRRNGEPWALETLVVAGNPLKKDGTPALTETEFQVVTYGRNVQDCPPWLSVAINSTQPVEQQW